MSWLLRIALCCWVALLTTALHAQDFLGIANSNYAGITGIDLQPASIVDSRYKFDLTIAGASTSLSNNYLGINRKGLTGGDGIFKNSNSYNNLVGAGQLLENLSGQKSLFFNLSLNLPSFMLTLSPRAAMAFTIRPRFVSSVTNLEANFVNVVVHGGQNPSLQGIQLTSQGKIELFQYVEYGLAYGRVLRDKGPHFFKVAGRLKYLQGVAAAILQADNVNYQVRPNDVVAFYPGTQFTYAYTNHFDYHRPLDFAHLSASSIGLDAGLVYEYRPDYQSYEYAMDGEKNLQDRTRNKYRWRLGLSILDLGSNVQFKNAFHSDYSVPAGTVNPVNVGKVHINNQGDINTLFINNNFTPSNYSDQFHTSLPTSLSLQVDYHVWRGFYANGTVIQSFRTTNTGTRLSNIYMVSPRWEGKRTEVSIPLSLNNSNQPNLGAAFRLGTLIVGSNSLLGLALGVNKEIRGADFYFALKVPVRFKRPGDRDKDQVSNPKDDCPRQYGTWEFKGCPDTDGDHVPDKEDKCPDQPGTISHQGCPPAAAPEVAKP